MADASKITKELIEGQQAISHWRQLLGKNLDTALQSIDPLMGRLTELQKLTGNGLKNAVGQALRAFISMDATKAVANVEELTDKLTKLKERSQQTGDSIYHAFKNNPFEAIKVAAPIAIGGLLAIVGAVKQKTKATKSFNKALVEEDEQLKSNIAQLKMLEALEKEGKASDEQLKQKDALMVSLQKSTAKLSADERANYKNSDDFDKKRLENLKKRESQLTKLIEKEEKAEEKKATKANKKANTDDQLIEADHGQSDKLKDELKAITSQIEATNATIRIDLALDAEGLQAQMQQAELTIGERWARETAYSQKLRQLHEGDAQKLQQIDEQQLQNQQQMLNQALEQSKSNGQSLQQSLGGGLALSRDNAKKLDGELTTTYQESLAKEGLSLAEQFVLHQNYYQQKKALYEGDAEKQRQINKEQLAAYKETLKKAAADANRERKADDSLLEGDGEIKLDIGGVETTLTTVGQLKKALADVGDELDALTREERAIKVAKTIGNIEMVNEALDQVVNLFEARNQSISKTADKNLVDLASKYEDTLKEQQEALDAFYEERDKANQQREEEQREADYQQSLQQSEEDIELLELKAAGETNIEKLKQLELQMQSAKGKKRELEEAQKKEEEEKKRAEEEKKREQELKDALALTQWEYEKSKVEVANNAGVAMAKNSQSAASVEKLTTSTRMGLMLAETTAKAATPLTGFAYAGAVALTIAGIAKTLSAPLPPDFTPSPLPARPFAKGGIIRPSKDGTTMMLNGLPSIVAEAGYPEMVLPLTPSNIENFMQPFATQIDKSSQSMLSYNGHTTLNIYNPTNADELVAELELNFDRTIAQMVNKANQRYSL